MEVELYMIDNVFVFQNRILLYTLSILTKMSIYHQLDNNPHYMIEFHVNFLQYNFQLNLFHIDVNVLVDRHHKVTNIVTSQSSSLNYMYN